MPNQNNFRTDLTEQQQATTFVSRIVRFPEEGILLEELPGSFGYNADDNVEFHFYTTQGNVLLVSVVASVSDEDIFKFHIVEYNDGTIKTYLRVDFTQLFEDKNIVLLPGDYKLSMNFFTDEIGSYNNKNLYIQEISPTRTEIQLGFVDNTNVVKINNNTKSLNEFIIPSFDKPTAIGVAEKIFKSGIELEDSTEGINVDSLSEIDALEISLTRIERAGLTPSLQTRLNEFLVQIYEKMKQKIIDFEGDKITREVFINMMNVSINEQLPILRSHLHSKIRVI